MAEVIDYWPQVRDRSERQMIYPWDRWIELDENGVGDIWLAEAGIDFPASSNVWHFRSILYSRAQYLTRRRKRDAPRKKVRVRQTGKIVSVPVYEVLHVKVRIVSELQVAFQFFEGEVPEEPPVVNAVVPARRRNTVARTPQQNREKVVMER